MRSFIIGPVEVRLEYMEHSLDLYVAPLQDQMLLGMEFLHQQEAHLNIDHDIMIVWRRSP